MNGNRIYYHVVSSQQDHRGAQVKATFQNHYLELHFARRETKDGFLWFGHVSVDGRVLWTSPETFGRPSREVLDGELQQQLYSWALRSGYVTRSHHGK